jgi:tetratricopeptide (TPR) repeat protein
LEEGRKIARQFNMTDALILADSHESWIYRSANDLELARARIDSALQNVDLDSVVERGSKVHKIVVSRAVGAKAMIRHIEEKFEDEEKLRKLELQLRSSAGESVARPLLRLVRFYLRRGNIQLAEEHLARVEAPRPRDLANLNYTRALIAEKKGELQEAIHLAERALEQNKRFGSGRGRRKYQRLLKRLRRKTATPTSHDKPKDENQSDEE